MSQVSELDVLRVIFPSVADNQEVKFDKLASNVFELVFSLRPSEPRQVQPFDLGPIGSSITAGLRITREKVYWLMPSIDKNLPSHVDTQVLYLKFPASRVNRERVACILPVTTEQHMGTLRGRASSVIACFESDLVTQVDRVLDGKVVIAIAPEIKDATHLAVDGARQILNISSGSAINHEGHIFSNTLT